MGTILCLSLRSMQCGCLNTAPQTETHTGRPIHINIRPPLLLQTHLLIHLASSVSFHTSLLEQHSIITHLNHCFYRGSLSCERKCCVPPHSAVSPWPSELMDLQNASHYVAVSSCKLFSSVLGVHRDATAAKLYITASSLCSWRSCGD